VDVVVEIVDVDAAEVVVVRKVAIKKSGYQSPNLVV
jgi:hypothetical protein